MSILIDANTRVLAQGMKGQRSMMAIKSSIEYGTNLVACVSFGMGGECIFGVPVYNTVRGAIKRHEIDASVIFSHGTVQVKQDVIEACKAGIKLIVVLEENINTHDLAELIAICRTSGSLLIGTNSNGIISVGKSKLGTIGGSEPEGIFLRGNIGVISRRVRLASEIGYLLKINQMGISTCVTMGSQAMAGTRMKDLMKMFLDDPETDIILLCGMDGSQEEDFCAEFLMNEPSKKPIVAFLPGFSIPNPIRKKFLGYSESDGTTIEEKREKLKQAGVIVVDKIQQIPLVISRFAKTLQVFPSSN